MTFAMMTVSSLSLVMARRTNLLSRCAEKIDEIQEDITFRRCHMAAINDLLRQITDATLRGRLEQEFARLSKNKKFGLVFEEHIPECTPLYDVSIKRGSTVARKGGHINDVLAIMKIDGDITRCRNKTTGEIEEIPLSELVAVALFGEEIFPALQPIDSVENAPDSSLWHTLIEADNYHALQLLEYLYPKKVDCIYIDPPYNTGARDWKYNNDYVDSADSWRHSKWLSMMQKRLHIANRLLKPDGVFAIAIDHNELAHLVCLLETSGMFDGYELTIVTLVHNPRGNITNNFARTNEYVIYLTPKSIKSLARTPQENDTPRKLRRWGHYSTREERRSMFYPIYVENGSVKRIGEQPADDFHPMGRNVPVEGKESEIEIWPIDQDGIERRWNFSQKEIASHLDRIVVLPKDGGLDLFISSELSPPKTVWAAPELDAGGVYGSALVENITKTKFPFPKSLYSVLRTIEPVVRKNPNALIVDFFAGSGTTLHAVNLLNAEDNGNRRCIMVTNNEVSDAESKALQKAGYQPGDPEWEAQGIAGSVTWPRTKYSIQGRRADGSEITGDYLSNQTIVKEEDRTFYHLGFVNNSEMLSLNAKKQIVSLLRGKDGKSQIPQTLVKQDSQFIVSDKHFASILFDPSSVDEWLISLDKQEHITNFYIVVKEAAAFNSIKNKIVELLGTITVSSFVKRPMSQGFPANVEYFKLGFLDKASVSLGQQFREILPLLWLKSGAIGRRPIIDTNNEPNMLILPENRFAILVDETRYAEFIEKLLEEENINTVYFVTNSEDAFREMSAELKAKNTYQLYHDYIDNFVLGARRDSL